MEHSNTSTTSSPPAPPQQPTATIVALPHSPPPLDAVTNHQHDDDNNNNDPGTSTAEESSNDFITIPIVDRHNSVPDTSNDAALAAALAAQEEEEEALLQQQQQPANNSNTIVGPSTTSSPNSNSSNNNYRFATASFPWQYDEEHAQCRGCGEEFNVMNRRHHCRLCGHVFCQHCTDQKALLPPSQIVLTPLTGKKGNRPTGETTISFTPDEDPDRMLTYYAPSPSSLPEVLPQQPQPQQPPVQLLYGKGLEERFQLAREPQRTCRACWAAVQPLQNELRHHNSHCMRFNPIDPTDPRRWFNSPLAFTLGHEIRKAAFTLHNLLPQPPRRLGAIVDQHDSYYNSNGGYNYYNNNNNNNMFQSELKQCQQNCRNISPNGSDWDGVRIPARLLEEAKGVAVLTTVKGGFGLAGIEFGTGLVLARTTGSGSNRWSAPSAIQMVSVAWGMLVGAQCTDHVFLLMTDDAVASFFQPHASVQLGADVAVAVGPLGRTIEGDWHLAAGGNNSRNSNNNHPTPAPSIYTYSLSKGLYAGVSLDGKVVTTRHDLNEKFYGHAVTPQEIWTHEPAPPAAQPLYEALQRCHVYASNSHNNNAAGSRRPHGVVPESSTVLNEYGEVARRGDAPSVANMSDITDF